MKKFLLFFTSIVLSFLLINNNVFAQEEDELPKYLKTTTYYNYNFVQENAYTYEYYVTYIAPQFLPETIEPNHYFIFEKINVKFRKGIHRNTNSYEFFAKSYGSTYTWFTLRVTVLKTLVDSDYSTDISKLFREDIILLVYATNDFENEYNRGYEEGYNNGYTDGLNDNEAYQRGYDHGYTEGYMDGWFDGLDQADPMAYERGYNNGYEDGLKASTSKFMDNLHIWLVPAIIIVVIAGIFVGYRKERHSND